MNPTPINWCDSTWNPIIGCTPCSPGCDNCYAAELHTKRHRAHLAGKQVPAQYGKPFSEIQFFPERLTEPIRRKKPTRIFVCSMGDWFHEDVKPEWIDQVMAAIALSPQHQFMVLTKRSERMLQSIARPGAGNQVCAAAAILRAGFPKRVRDTLPSALATHEDYGNAWPLPNLWLGVTSCNQHGADEKIPLLLQAPAAHRFTVIEPMLGPIRLDFVAQREDSPHSREWTNALTGRHESRSPVHGFRTFALPARLNLVIVGGETGPNARPMHPDWVRSVRDQCAAAQVPFHFKGWGEWCAFPQIDDRNYSHISDWPNSRYIAKLRGPDVAHASDPCPVYRLGSRRSGRLLDGREHNGAEEVR